MTPANRGYSAPQIKYTAALLLPAGLLQSSLLFGMVGEDAWIAALLSLLLLLPIGQLYKTLLFLPDRDPAESVFVLCLGKGAGTAVNALYGAYFMLSAAVDIRHIGNIISGILFPEMSVLVIPGMFFFIMLYAAEKGAPAITSLAFVLFTAVAVLHGADMILQLSQWKAENLLPLLQSPPRDLIRAVFYGVTVPMGKIALLLFLPPAAEPLSQRPSARTYRYGLLCGGILMLLILLRDTGILGALVRSLNSTLFESVQLLDAFGFLSRVEVIFVFSFLLKTAFSASLSCSTASGLFGRSLSLKKPGGLPMILATAGGIFAVSCFLFRTTEQLRDFMRDILPFVSVWFLLLLPALACLVGSLRRRRRGGKEKG